MGLPELKITPYTAQEILDNGWACDLAEAKKIVKEKTFPPKAMLDDYQLGNGVTAIHIDMPAVGNPKLTIDMDVNLNEVTISEVEAVINKN